MKIKNLPLKEQSFCNKNSPQWPWIKSPSLFPKCIIERNSFFICSYYYYYYTRACFVADDNSASVFDSQMHTYKIKI